ncbi:putative AC transposase, partial [Bienertia sinuspersici]
MDWGRKMRREALLPKLNYMGMLLKMHNRVMPFVYNRDRIIELFSKFIITDELPFTCESSNYDYFNRVVKKVFSLSLVNATTNTRADEFLKEDPSLNLLLNGSLTHIRSCAHIFNLSVQEVWSLDTPTKWNSTYKLLNDEIRYHEVLTKLYNESRSDLDSSIMSIGHLLRLFVIFLQGNDFDALSNILSSMKVKWYNYFKEFPHIYGIAAILDLGVKTN